MIRRVPSSGQISGHLNYDVGVTPVSKCKYDIVSNSDFMRSVSFCFYEKCYHSIVFEITTDLPFREDLLVFKINLQYSLTKMRFWGKYPTITAAFKKIAYSKEWDVRVHTSDRCKIDVRCAYISCDDVDLRPTLPLRHWKRKEFHLRLISVSSSVEDATCIERLSYRCHSAQDRYAASQDGNLIGSSPFHRKSPSQRYLWRQA